MYESINKIDKKESLIDSVKTSQNKKSIPWPKPNFKKLKILKEAVLKSYFVLIDKIKPFIKDNKKICIVSASVVVLLLLIFVAIAFIPSGKGHLHSQSKQQAEFNSIYANPKENKNPIHDQLNDISAKLANIEQNMSSKHAYVDLAQIRQSLQALKVQVNQLSSHSDQILSEEIKASTAQLQGQLVTIKKELKVITTKKLNHRMLQASSLPFKVLSIDNIQQSEVVTIIFDNKVLPIDIGDSVAGWTLATASNVNQKAEFKNTKNDYVLINLDAIKNTRG